MKECSVCNIGYEDSETAEKCAQSHRFSVVSRTPLILHLELPDGCNSERWEAVEAFADLFGKAHQLFPTTPFQLVPQSYDSGNLRSLLLVYLGN